MSLSTTLPTPSNHSSAAPISASATSAPRRISSAVLLGDARAIEIEHGGRIYQLRITQLNKLILTA